MEKGNLRIKMRFYHLFISHSSAHYFDLVFGFSGFEQEEVLRPLHVSLPIGATAHGTRASVYYQ